MRPLICGAYAHYDENGAFIRVLSLPHRTTHNVLVEP